MEEKIKVVFLGTPDFAVPTLRTLCDDSRIDVQLVVTQPDKEVGRKRELTPPPVKVLAEGYGITIVQPDDVNQADVIETVSKIKPDFVVVVAYGQILGPDWLSVAKEEILNIHASLLPKYRGASPIQSAILSGDEVTGISIMGIRKKMDSGPVYLQEEVEIGEKHAWDLFGELAEKGAQLLAEVILEFDRFMPVEQEEKEATFCKKIDREGGEVSFEDMTAEEIVKRWRAYYGWPGIYTYWDGKRLKLTDIELCDCEDEIGIPTRCCDYVSVSAKEGAILIHKLQLEGKQEMDTLVFLKGRGDFLGSKLG